MIPYEEYNRAGTPLHFLHANGYPPLAYRLLLESLANHFHVMAMRMRPMWADSSPAALTGWQTLADDLEIFLDERGFPSTSTKPALVGVGHSVGATTTLRLALRRPNLFQSLILIDPVIFPPWMVVFWNLIYRLGLAYRIHPLAKATLRRRNNFSDRQAMFDNYRKKPIFSRVSDESLHAYVDSLACEKPGGGLKLCYTPEWEARIYVTGILHDLTLWRRLPTLLPPVLVLRGQHTDTFWPSTARLFQRKLPSAQIETISNATHLLPLEKPEEVAQILINFIEKKRP